MILSCLFLLLNTCTTNYIPISLRFVAATGSFLPQAPKEDHTGRIFSNIFYLTLLLP